MTEFAKKAEIYHASRWDYSVHGIELIVDISGMSNNTTVADVGAGTGILTKHFADLAGRVYAVEPDRNMLAVLTRNLVSKSRVIPL